MHTISSHLILKTWQVLVFENLQPKRIHKVIFKNTEKTTLDSIKCEFLYCSTKMEGLMLRLGRNFWTWEQVNLGRGVHHH